MNAATRAQVLRLIKRTMDQDRPDQFERARRILRAGQARDRQRPPADPRREGIYIPPVDGTPGRTIYGDFGPGLDAVELDLSQADYCRGCAHFGGCNVILAAGETCSDRFEMRQDPEPALEPFDGWDASDGYSDADPGL